jgi:hypothetical protein
MDVQQIQMTRHEAALLYRDYRKHLFYSAPIDHEIMRAYQLLAQGRLVVQALKSIGDAGLNEKKQPRLAICRADAATVSFSSSADGSAVMRDARVQPRHRNNSWSHAAVIQSRSVFAFPRGTFKDAADIPSWRGITATVPLIPLNLRPRRALQNYHLLWEAQWSPLPPHDPLLLRRIGRSDLWLVLAQWDLTPVERAVLATRIAA